MPVTWRSKSFKHQNVKPTGRGPAPGTPVSNHTRGDALLKRLRAATKAK